MTNLSIDYSDGKQVYEKFDRLRREQGLSWYEISKRTGLSRSVFHQWQNAHSLPTLGSLAAVCEALGVSLLDFFAEEGEAVPLTADERLFLRAWKHLQEPQRQALLHLLHSLVNP